MNIECHHTHQCMSQRVWYGLKVGIQVLAARHDVPRLGAGV